MSHMFQLEACQVEDAWAASGFQMESAVLNAAMMLTMMMCCDGGLGGNWIPSLGQCFRIRWIEQAHASLMFLRGHMNLNSVCMKDCAERLLGKHSNCKPSVFGDVVHLMKHFTLTNN